MGDRKSLTTKRTLRNTWLVRSVFINSEQGKKKMNAPHPLKILKEVKKSIVQGDFRIFSESPYNFACVKRKQIKY